ncbi:hypothetical protein BH10PSE7_BH10PSE7_19840 [soil metagenome]
MATAKKAKSHLKTKKKAKVTQSAKKTAPKAKASTSAQSAPAHKPAVKAKSAAKPAAAKPIAQASRSSAPPVAAKPAVAAKPVAAVEPAPPVRPVAPAPVAKAAPPVAAALAQPRKLAFKVGELIVYPAHGVGKVVQIEVQEIAGIQLELYIIDFEKEKLRLKVPTSKADQKGMRKLADRGLIDQAMRVLKGRARIKRTMWSRRAQEYEAKINSGDMIAVAEVVRDLYRSDKQPEQSYSERQLFEQALERMSREIAAVKKIDDDISIKEVSAFLDKNAHRNVKVEEPVPTEQAA